MEIGSRLEVLNTAHLVASALNMAAVSSEMDEPIELILALLVLRSMSCLNEEEVEPPVLEGMAGYMYLVAQAERARGVLGFWLLESVLVLKESSTGFKTTKSTSFPELENLAP